ncbi:MAG: hypothetical protein QG671_3607, partial [Actinomycetota bacterium]|nr:hypothetical protein [Actinomycetota bacterium]
QDLNLRPLGYEPSELPNCSTPRRWNQPYAIGGPQSKTPAPDAVPGLVGDPSSEAPGPRRHNDPLVKLGTSPRIN